MRDSQCLFITMRSSQCIVNYSMSSQCRLIWLTMRGSQYMLLITMPGSQCMANYAVSKAHSVWLTRLYLCGSQCIVNCLAHSVWLTIRGSQCILSLTSSLWLTMGG